MSPEEAPSAESYPTPAPYEGGGGQDEEDLILKPYGVGIDCHSRFIQVCVLVPSNKGCTRHDNTFSTQWEGLTNALTWTIRLLRDVPDVAVQEDLDLGLRYNIESTGTYHLPVLQAWGGRPSVVNPLLASPSRRKTDVLDAKLLAYHCLTGLWPPSFIVCQEVQIARCLMLMREGALRQSTQTSNKVNNIVLRFGHTVGASHRVTDTAGRAIIEDLCAGRVPKVECVSPAGLPGEVGSVILELYDMYDAARERSARYTKLAEKYVLGVEYVTGYGEVLTGKQLRDLLQTVPGVGPLSGLYWLTEVVDVNRFPTVKACVAYCGCDPTLKVSAGKVTSYSRRGGNQRIHATLKHAAQALIIHATTPLGVYGRAMWKSKAKGGFKKACGAVARRMVEGMYHVHRTGQPYNAELYQFANPPEYEDAQLDLTMFGRQGQLLGDIKTVQELATAFRAGTLADRKGVGAKCLKTVEQFLSSRRRPWPTASTRNPRPSVSDPVASSL